MRGEVPPCGPRQGRDTAARVRGCNMRALGAPSACTPDARRNAMALQSAWLELGVSRSRLWVARRSMDKLVWSGDQVHSANQKFMPKQTQPIRCLAKCQGHLGKSWSGQKLQILVSLDARESGEVSL